MRITLSQRETEALLWVLGRGIDEETADIEHDEEYGHKEPARRERLAIAEGTYNKIMRAKKDQS